MDEGNVSNPVFQSGVAECSLNFVALIQNTTVVWEADYLTV